MYDLHGLLTLTAPETISSCVESMLSSRVYSGAVNSYVIYVCVFVEC